MNNTSMPAFAPSLPAWRLALLLLCGLCATPAAFAGAHSKAGGSTPALLYHNYCSVCHGDKGDGNSRAKGSLNPPPRDFTAPAAAQISRERMVDAVTNGRPGTAMTGWKTQLNNQEIGALVDYIRNSFMPAAANSDASRGRIVYSKNCAVCHGDNGDGRSRAQASLNPAPRDFTAPAARAELSRERMITSVTYGRPETAMAGFKTQLSSADIDAVVDYIRHGFMAQADLAGVSGISHGRRHSAPDALPAAPASQPPQPAPAAPRAVDMRAPFPKGLQSNATKGGAFYMANCATCHGVTGDGRGPRAYFIMPKPRNFLHPAARAQLNREALFKAVSDGKLGTEMPAWSQVLQPQEIADVSEFVFQRFIAPAKAAK